MVTENLKIALRAIMANKMRSILTVLGVMIGVASVIAVVSLVQGMQHKIAGDLEGIGSNFIQVFARQPDDQSEFSRKMPELTMEDGEAVRRGTPSVAEYTPLYRTFAELRAGDALHSAELYAVSPSYQEIVNHWVERGRFFTSLDEDQKKRVCVIGLEVIRELQLGDNVLGRQIQLGSTSFTIVGVFEKKGGAFGDNDDDVIVIPFSTATVIYGSERMRTLVLAFQMRPGSDMDLVKEQITEILRTRHDLKDEDKNDFRIMAQEEILKVISSVLLTASLIMGAIVGIALLVGGIGIMNIMLVSVTERTREIGIRKSLGARRRDVLLQFLIEAIALSGLGGIVGIIGGWVLANVIRLIINRWVEFPPVHTPFWATAIAFTFCAALGIIFGLYPAAKASKLDPIEALRYE